MNIGHIIIAALIVAMAALTIIAIVAYSIDAIQDIRLRRFISKKKK